MRVRSESRFYSERNSDIVSNWSSINSGNGFDTNTNTNLQLPPLLNTRQDRRNLWRIRARLGIEATIGQHTTAGVRLASSSSNGPVSTTEQLGGGLSKDVWLDQAWLAYSPADWVTVRGGRFGNPFWTSDTLFSNDLNFDGLAANLQYDFDGGDLGLFANLAVVPLEYTSDSAPSQSRVKTPNENKWLSGAQVGMNWRFNDDNALRAALGYYDFKNISGSLSSPCALYAGAVGCDTDWSRPAFMQKGNTLMLIRDIARNPLDPAQRRPRSMSAWPRHSAWPRSTCAGIRSWPRALACAWMATTSATWPTTSRPCSAAPTTASSTTTVPVAPPSIPSAVATPPGWCRPPSAPLT